MSIETIDLGQIVGDLIEEMCEIEWKKMVHGSGHRENGGQRHYHGFISQNVCQPLAGMSDALFYFVFTALI